ncbi:hypothetical protein LZA78_04790 [Sinirhodobacter sp. WL0062]|uniref:Uncharacterized protein n=1 Tax=Rhodobacter flavimaris TaxID=2907145 RepID=A0ABS8YTK7_9RHOB|nr:hypothetical protein [Sinirhodobacter sp. WL0062]MCE5972788.1 hypothetical protein [Sinirhodobacter sp. WL0062]
MHGAFRASAFPTFEEIKRVGLSAADEDKGTLPVVHNTMKVGYLLDMPINRMSVRLLG